MVKDDWKEEQRKEYHQEMVAACELYKEAPTKANDKAWKLATDRYNMLMHKGW